MPYNGQNPSNIGKFEFSEHDRRMANGILRTAEQDRRVSAQDLLRLEVLEAHGSIHQAAYFLMRLGAIEELVLDIDLPRDNSGLVHPEEHDKAVGALWKWSGIAKTA